MEPSDSTILQRALRRARPLTPSSLRFSRSIRQQQQQQLQQQQQQRLLQQHDIDATLRERLLALAEMQQAFIRELRERETGTGTGTGANSPQHDFETRMRRVIDLERAAIVAGPTIAPACNTIATCRHWTREDVVPRAEAAAYPEWALCPITLQPFCDPVVALDGHTYERLAIATWLQTHGNSPLTNECLNHNLITNFTMRRAVDSLTDELATAKKNDQ